MNNLIVANVWRFSILVALQGLVFQNIGVGWEQFPYLHIVIFPIFIMLLPLRTTRGVVLLLGFAVGLAVDFLYNTLGVHASAAVFTAYIRPFVLKVMEPRNGYNVNYSPTIARMGIGWFMRYAGMLLVLHLFFYFSVEAFTFVYFVDILLKTIISFLVSMVFVMIYQLLFNPVD
jgi:hypothetical protein